MNCADFTTAVLDPALAFIRANLSFIPESVEERAMLLAIAGQESDWTDRVQTDGGYAHSFWQFERNGVLGLMLDDETASSVRALCYVSGIPYQSTAIWQYMATAEADRFSAAMARLLLWSDPRPLPQGQAASFDYYVKNWAPGAPDSERWANVWPQVTAELGPEA